MSLARVLLVEPNASLRAALVTLLQAERYDVQLCDSLVEVRHEADGHDGDVALMAWQAMDGLLAEEHRAHLVQLTRDLRLVLMVPRRWMPLLQQTDLDGAVTALVAKPFEADELLTAVRRALLSPVHS